MALPGIIIEFENGNLGRSTTLPDGLGAIIASATAVGATFVLGTPYKVKSMADVAALGILPDVSNYKLYKTLQEFYKEAGEGAELYLIGIDKDKKVSDWFTPDVVTGKTIVEVLLDAAGGKINFIGTCFSPADTYVPVVTKGIDADVFAAASLAQALAESYTERKYAPFFTIIEGYAYDGNKIALEDLNTYGYNRVGVLIGDSEKRTGTPPSNGAAIGCLLGRIAQNQVHENIGKVRDGATTLVTAYIIDVAVEQYDVESLHDKGYITWRQHTGRSGYFFTDDPLACAVEDDYHYITNRRTIDKAYRLAYQGSLDFLLDDMNVNADGTIGEIDAVNVENVLESLIESQMTNNGELSKDANNPSDRGVICEVDRTWNVVSSQTLKIAKLQVRSKSINRWIAVPIGFVPVN